MVKKFSCMAAAFILLGTASLAHAGFIGRELSGQYYFPNSSTPYNNSTAVPTPFIVGSGVETIFDVELVTQITTDFTDDSVSFNFATSLSSPTWSTASFNGVVFNLVSGAPLNLLSATVDPGSTLAGFDVSRISFSNNQLTVNWQGLSYVDGTTLRINFEVPEPTVLGLLGIGLLGLGIGCRKPALSQNG